MCSSPIAHTAMATVSQLAAIRKAAPEEIPEHTPIYQDIVFSNIKATVQRGRRAGLIWGLPEAPVTNVLLENVEITSDKPFGIFCAKGVRLVNSKIVTPDGIIKVGLLCG
jgi:polygalacturonase